MLGEYKKLISPISSDLQKVCIVMQEALSNNYSLLEKINKYFLSHSGKQLRSVLVLLCGGSSNKEKKKELINVAAIFELIHNATLVHDDILDHAKLRRQKKTISHRWGNETAVLYGDFILGQAFLLSSQISKKGFVSHVAKATSDVCQGELLQNEWSFKKTTSLDTYFKIIELKTASLFAHACQAASLVGGYNKKDQIYFYEFGNYLGVAFQMMDDCIDLQGSEKNSGKSTFRDLAEGKLTYPVFTMLGECDKNERSYFKKELFSLKGISLKKFKRKLKEAKAIESTQTKAIYYLQKSRKALLSIKNNYYQKELLQFLDILQKPLL